MFGGTWAQMGWDPLLYRSKIVLFSVALLVTLSPVKLTSDQWPSRVRPPGLARASNWARTTKMEFWWRHYHISLQSITPIFFWKYSPKFAHQWHLKKSFSTYCYKILPVWQRPEKDCNNAFVILLLDSISPIFYKLLLSCLPFAKKTKYRKAAHNTFVWKSCS